MMGPKPVIRSFADLFLIQKLSGILLSLFYFSGLKPDVHTSQPLPHVSPFFEQ